VHGPPSRLTGYPQASEASTDAMPQRERRTVWPEEARRRRTARKSRPSSGPDGEQAPSPAEDGSLRARSDGYHMGRNASLPC